MDYSAKQAVAGSIGYLGGDAPTPAKDKENLVDQFGYEVNSIFHAAQEVERICNRIYGSAPPTVAVQDRGKLEAIPTCLVDQYNALQRARSLLEGAVRRLAGSL